MDIRQNNYAVLGHFGPFWAILCPKFCKTFFRKIRMCDFGTSDIPESIMLYPLKTAKPFFGK